MPNAFVGFFILRLWATVDLPINNQTMFYEELELKKYSNEFLKLHIILLILSSILNSII